MVSLCAQMEVVFNLDDRKANSFAGAPFKELVVYFHSLLAIHPVLLFIDSLDQLSDDDLGRSRLSFLQGVWPHEDGGRIVVSCLPDNRETDPETNRVYMYQCETRLTEGRVPRVDVRMSEEPGAAAANEAMDMLEQLLLRRHWRRLQETQRWVVLERLAEETEKTALYVHLVVGVISQWTSSEVAAVDDLKGGVRVLIAQLFDALERDYGKELVRTALALLTFAAKGMNSTEMEDLLSTICRGNEDLAVLSVLPRANVFGV